jgi:hypothetical protein
MISFEENSSSNKDKDKDKDKDENISREVLKKNITSVVMYALSMSTALAFNDLITTIFDSFQNTKHVIVKTTFFVALFGFSIFVAVYLNT